MKYFILFLLPTLSLAHEAGEMSVRIGPTQGITEYSEKLGFKLGDKAIARFKLKFATVPEGAAFQPPAEAVVRVLGEKGVYRRRDGYFKRVEVSELKPGDEILASGTGFVRVIESAFGKPEVDEHGHEGEHHD